jgi:hypothetical protein
MTATARRITAVALLTISLAGCASSTAGSPSSTAPVSPYSHTQVLGWVTPTLANGISLVGSLSPNSSATELVSSSQPLKTAATVSLHELSQVSWNGALGKDERTLVATLKRIGTLTGTAPGPDYLAKLDAGVDRTQKALQVLARAVNR